MKKKTTEKKKTDKGYFVQTYSGHSFYPAIPKISKIAIEDVAHALSHLCRYSGHCRMFYSVAEHSVLVAQIARSMWPDDHDTIWAALLHDATEAYIGDITTPLKVLLPQFNEVEDKLTKDIAKEFKIKWNKRVAARVKIADMIALSTEARKLFADVSHWDSIREYTPRPDLLTPWFPASSNCAKAQFMREFNWIRGEQNERKVKG